MKVSDDLILARFLLGKITEKYGAYVNYDPKPMTDYNGSGGHVNFSTKEMRSEGGDKFIYEVINKLEKTHLRDMADYGDDNHLRMTGKHETSSIDKFTSGVGDRGASVRISKSVKAEGKGYIEDRRPAANLDPYKVFRCIMNSIFESNK